MILGAATLGTNTSASRPKEVGSTTIVRSRLGAGVRIFALICAEWDCGMLRRILKADAIAIARLDGCVGPAPGSS